MSNRKVEEFLYEPHNTFYGHNWKPDLDHCRFSVAEHDRITTWHQCTRKVVEQIEGYGFCKQHGKEVKRKLGILDQETFTKYAAEFSYGKPTLVQLELLSETEKMIEVASSKKLMGSNHFINGRQLKQSNYLRGYQYFDDRGEALLWLYQESEKHWIKMRAALNDSVSEMNSLASLVRQYGKEKV